MKIFWKSSVSYCEHMGVFSLTVTKLKQEFFLYDFLSLDKTLENMTHSSENTEVPVKQTNQNIQNS